MADIKVKCGREPESLAELIASTLHGHVAPDPSSTAADVGRMVRAEQEQVERTRPSWQDMTTVDFARLDDHDDWTDV